mmetsp:Transcript_22497/g.19460  ORF Transcript_22497/g.19460 Transcript_22497/m.19460 type:complete len:209 (-) Transcript_22497:1616-2242(-)
MVWIVLSTSIPNCHHRNRFGFLQSLGCQCCSLPNFQSHHLDYYCFHNHLGCSHLDCCCCHSHLGFLQSLDYCFRIHLGCQSLLDCLQSLDCCFHIHLGCCCHSFLGFRHSCFGCLPNRFGFHRQSRCFCCHIPWCCCKGCYCHHQIHFDFHIGWIGFGFGLLTSSHQHSSQSNQPKDPSFGVGCCFIGCCLIGIHLHQASPFRRFGYC